ncbi:LETM1 and EF-hand domain-containing protein anon-60Da, mitochondrial [Ceratobasidium sp. AG-Ba]|nr:LETM1 and EF-hand domain-containing protein anon-60Da, mitochondrial [Ceratobasidium sp. AG-Ba]QRW08079.1 LETM1 and EF-hand domain-containing protein anon-60Da, mitochondrial [Ceratobasidium sp. AG-Ba]
MLTIACPSAVASKNAPAAYPLPLTLQLRARAQSQALTYTFKPLEPIAINATYRLYSSLPPGLASESQKSQVDPVFTSAVSKKPKVDLKPSPRPANSSSPSQDNSRPPAGHVGAGKAAAVGPQPANSSAPPKAEAAKAAKADEATSSAPPSKIKMAIADVVKAAEAGALVPPPKDAGKIAKLWHQAKELFKFYVRGLKQLLTHRQIVKDIQARVKDEKAQGIPSTMTWEEAHFIKTYQEDLVKLVPFLLILLILEEALPLVVLYAPFLLPSTCILPNQRARILWKRDDAQYMARQDVRRIIAELGPVSEIVNNGVAGMSEQLVTSLTKTFGLSTRGPVMLHRRRLEKHLAYLLDDDRLLVDESHMGSHLDLRNLRNAMSERGFLASAEESQLRTTLERRLKALGEDAAQWKSASLEFLLTDLVESNKDIRPTPVD